MRERTTWNRDQIKQASTARKAEDPTAMNQDHLSQQPAADKYVNGDPSSWKEDVTSPNRWEEEYSGGAVKRDEIGMPELRKETFNHPEKTAASEALLIKKADLCIKVARMMLAGRKFASDDVATAAIEEQSVALMHMPDEALVATHNNLADQSAVMASPAVPEMPSVAACQQEATTAIQAGDLAGAKTALMKMEAATRRANEQPAAAPVATSPAPAAPPPAAAAPAAAQPAAADPMVLHAMVMAAVNEALNKRANDQQQGQQPQGQQDQGQQATVQPVAQQPQQQGQPQQGQQEQAQQMTQQGQPEQQAPQTQQAQQMADDAMLDELMMPEQQMMSPEGDIELEAAPMDVGEVQLTPEDDVLKTLFANEESEQAEQAQQDQGQKQAGMPRVASTRTIGTRPTGGVSRVGGGSAGPANGGREIDRLAALWPSAPDVREAFGQQ